MRRKNHPGPQRKKPRRYHLADDEPCYFENDELPDWVVGGS